MNKEATEKKSLDQKKDDLIEILSLIEDEYERLTYIIDLGKDLPPMCDDYRQEMFRIDGCTSNLWLFPSYQEGVCQFQVDSDSAITKGIAAMLAELYNGHSPEEILRVPSNFLSDVGVPQLLSPNRRNGLSNLSSKIMSYAQLCKEKYSQ